jgi:hypothetical protein
VLALPPQAEAALEVARRDGEDLRFVVLEHCETRRFRLSVRYRAGGRDVNLGLLWSEDRAALEALRARLAAGAAG